MCVGQNLSQKVGQHDRKLFDNRSDFSQNGDRCGQIAFAQLTRQKLDTIVRSLLVLFADESQKLGGNRKHPCLYFTRLDHLVDALQKGSGIDLGNVEKDLQGRVGGLGLTQTFAQLGQIAFQQLRNRFRNESKQIEETQLFGRFALRQQTHQCHHMVVNRISTEGINFGQHTRQCVVAANDRIDQRLDVWRQNFGVIDGRQRQIAGQVATELSISSMEKFDGNGHGHFQYISLAVIQKYARNDIAGDFGMRWVVVLATRFEVLLKARFEQRDQGLGMAFDRAGVSADVEQERKGKNHQKIMRKLHLIKFR